MLPQIVIFEGIDGVGKSTQIKLLKSHYFKNQQHNKYVEVKSFSNVPGIDDETWQENVIQYYWNFLHKLIFIESKVSKQFPIFIDRSHIGELVYGKLYRGLNCETLNRIVDLNIVFKYCKTSVKFILYVDYNRALIYEDGKSVNAENRVAKFEQFEFIKAFNKIKTKYPNLNISIIDVTNKNEKEVNEMTIKALEEFE